MAMNCFEDKIFQATTAREAVFVICETDIEKQLFIDWILAYRPDVNLQFTKSATQGYGYAYVADFTYGPDGIIDRLNDPNGGYGSYQCITFDAWYGEVGLTDVADDVDCNLDDLL